MLAAFALGYVFGIGSVAAAFDIRRALRAREAREQFAQECAERRRFAGKSVHS
jgi:hypothetical protein